MEDGEAVGENYDSEDLVVDLVGGVVYQCDELSWCQYMTGGRIVPAKSD
jgi:hypothetical protein